MIGVKGRASTTTRYVARCVKCGCRARATTTGAPGRNLRRSPTTFHSTLVVAWQGAKTFSDALPLVVLCRRCLGLKPT